MKSTRRLAGNLEDIVADAEDTLKETADTASQEVCAGRTRLRAALESARIYCKSLEGKAVAGAKATDQMVRTHPYQAVGLALSVGVLVGYLLKRRNPGQA